MSIEQITYRRLALGLVAVVVAVVAFVQWSAESELAGQWDRIESKAPQYAPPAEFVPLGSEREGDVPCYSVSGCENPRLVMTYEFQGAASEACALLSESFASWAEPSDFDELSSSGSDVCFLQGFSDHQFVSGGVFDEGNRYRIQVVVFA